MEEGTYFPAEGPLEAPLGSDNFGKEYKMKLLFIYRHLLHIAVYPETAEHCSS